MSSVKNDDAKPNCKITRYGYIINKHDLTKKQLDNIKNDLTVRPYRMKQYDFGNDISFPVYHESGDFIKVLTR